MGFGTPLRRYDVMYSLAAHFFWVVYSCSLFHVVLHTACDCGHTFVDTEWREVVTVWLPWFWILLQERSRLRLYLRYDMDSWLSPNSSVHYSALLSRVIRPALHTSKNSKSMHTLLLVATFVLINETSVINWRTVVLSIVVQLVIWFSWSTNGWLCVPSGTSTLESELRPLL